MVVISLLAYFSWLLGRVAFWDFIEPDLRRLLAVDGFGSRIPDYEYAYLFWAILSVASYFGIWILQRWGRSLLLLTFVLSCISAPFSGAMINAPVERLLMMIFLFSDGGIVALGYLAWPEIFSKRPMPDDSDRSDKAPGSN
jgi:membrane-associated phospholipid phosphatase